MTDQQPVATWDEMWDSAGRAYAYTETEASAKAYVVHGEWFGRLVTATEFNGYIECREESCLAGGCEHLREYGSSGTGDVVDFHGDVVLRIGSMGEGQYWDGDVMYPDWEVTIMSVTGPVTIKTNGAEVEVPEYRIHPDTWIVPPGIGTPEPFRPPFVQRRRGAPPIEDAPALVTFQADRRLAHATLFGLAALYQAPGAQKDALDRHAKALCAAYAKTLPFSHPDHRSWAKLWTEIKGSIASTNITAPDITVSSTAA